MSILGLEAIFAEGGLKTERVWQDCEACRLWRGHSQARLRGETGQGVARVARVSFAALLLLRFGE